MTEHVVRRLTLLQNEAERVPVPTRKFFHIGLPQQMEDVGECLPMVSWVDDNLSRYVVSDVASGRWGRGAAAFVFGLPNVAVQPGDGVLLVTGCGNDESVPHPSGKGQMHFVHMGRTELLFDATLAKLYVYRLDGVQLKSVASVPG